MSSSTPTRHGVGSNQYRKKGTSKRRERHAALAAMAAGSTGPAIPPEEVGQCSFAFVPASAGAAGTGNYRQCRNAIRVSPGAPSGSSKLCHCHGGAQANSFGGKTVAKATAEAQRGELRLPPAEFWEGAEARYELLQGQVANMFRRDPETLAALVDGASRLHAAQNKESGVARFSTGNQFLVVMQHYQRARDEGLDGNDALEAAFSRASQPHMTAKRWAEHGRHPDGDPVAVTHFQPASYIRREAGETDDEFTERCRKAKGHSTVLLQYPLSATHGDPYEAPPDPMAHLNASIKARATPAEVDSSIGRLTDWGRDRGYDIEWSDARPVSGGREVDGYWNASASRIVVWKGVGGGSPAARLHVLGHELGHAELGHGTCGSAEASRPDAEAGAETYGYLVSSRCGVEAGDAAKVYISGWQSRTGLRRDAASLPAVRSAVVAADRLFSTFVPAHDSDERAISG